MVAVPCNHFAQLFDSIFQDFGIRLRPHALKSCWAPGRDFGLHKNPVTVAVVEYTFVLGPMDTREDAVEVLHVRMVVPDPIRRFCHSEFRVAPRHAFHAHQTHAFAV